MIGQTQRRFLAGTLAISLIAPFSIFAQKKIAKASDKAASSIQKCSGAWTGTIRYTRTQTLSNNKTVDRVSGRGQDTTDFQMKYDYKANVSVTEAAERNGSSRGSAVVTHNFTSTETVKAVESNSCDRGKTWKQMTGTSISQTKTSGNQTVEANVSVGINEDGTYSVSVAIPPIEGQTTGSQSSEYSGQCVPKEGKSFNLPPTKTTIDGNSLTSDGKDRVNPADPNRLNGTFTRSWQNVTETITWNLEKCGAELRLIDLTFEEMKFPNWNDWQEIVEQKGTIDGNFVKIKARVLNISGETKYADVKFKETYKGDKWDGARPDGTLNGGEISVRVEPGEEREVELVWDSSGYSWFDDGRPRYLQRIKAELEENGKKVDEITKNLKVAPKPVVLVHGLWSSWRAWESWQNILTTSHSYDWKAFPVGEKPEKGVMNTGGSFMSAAPTKSIAENARELETYIKYAQEDRNAWHVDIVAHSMGGLISRYYISQIMPADSPDGRPRVSHLVMLGTPNMGSPCADVMNVAFESLGKNVEAVRQLRQDYVAGFNRINTNRKGVKFSVLAGDPLPTMCKSIVWNDGVVPVPSAVWQIRDNARSKSLHTDLTGTSDFSSFVKPRLAIGPKGDHNPALPEVSGSNGRTTGSGSSLVWYLASFGAANAVNNRAPEDTWAKAVAIEGRSSAELDIDVGNVQNFGLTFMAPVDVSVELFDQSGSLRGHNRGGSPESTGWFRSIFVENNIKSGRWKIVFKNESNSRSEVVITSWQNARN